MKRILLSLIVLLPLWGLTQTEQQPNVLLILVDDLKPNLGVYGDSIAHSPNIDKLANKGMRFENAYCNQAVCGPSRYTLMLGTRSTSSGLYRFGAKFRDVYPDAITLPQYFMANGYHAESMGKVFHIGHGNTNDDASWSIPHHKEKVIEYILPASTNGQLTREEAFFENSRMYLDNIPPNKQLPRGAAWEMADVTDEAYADGRVARHAIDRLRVLAKQEQPFFMAVGFARPHLPFCVPKHYWDFYDPERLPMPTYTKPPEDAPLFTHKLNGEISQFFPIPERVDGPYEDSITRKLIHGYYASLSYMDAQVGRVMDELERLQLDKNTIVVLWGDHGWHLGDHASWTKHTNFEQANRIPIIMLAPEMTQAGTVSYQLVETVDIYPTLASLAGLATPEGPQPIDGLDLSPVLKNPQARVRDHAYHCFPKRPNGTFLVGSAIRTKRYRMIAWINPQSPEDDIIYELYDYQDDPFETKNLAAERPEIVARLKAILDTHPSPKPLAKRQ
ncbi:MAG: sulfatase [Bacteroidota bacterium]